MSRWAHTKCNVNNCGQQSCIPKFSLALIKEITFVTQVYISAINDIHVLYKHESNQINKAVLSSRQTISICSVSFSGVNLVLHIHGTIKSNSLASFAITIKLRQAAILDK